MGFLGDLLGGIAPLAGAAGGYFLGGIPGASLGLGLGSSLSSNAALGDARSRSAGFDIESAQKALALQEQAMLENNKRYSSIEASLNPYIQGGRQGFDSLGGLLGLSGGQAQQNQLDIVRNSPFFQSQLNVSRDGLARLSAETGNLYGGNRAAITAQQEPQLFAQAIQQQIQALGGLANTGLGAANALGQSAFGFGQLSQEDAVSRGNLYRSIGNAQGEQATAPAISNSANSNLLQQAAGYFFNNSMFGGGGNNNAVVGNGINPNKSGGFGTGLTPPSYTNQLYSGPSPRLGSFIGSQQ